MQTIFEASLDTRSFEFKAFGPDARSALDALVDGLLKHTAQYNLAPRWFVQDDINVRRFTMGVAYRDREEI